MPYPFNSSHTIDLFDLSQTVTASLHEIYAATVKTYVGDDVFATQPIEDLDKLFVKFNDATLTPDDLTHLNQVKCPRGKLFVLKKAFNAINAINNELLLGNFSKKALTERQKTLVTSLESILAFPTKTKIVVLSPAQETLVRNFIDVCCVLLQKQCTVQIALALANKPPKQKKNEKNKQAPYKLPKKTEGKAEHNLFNKITEACQKQNKAFVETTPSLLLHRNTPKEKTLEEKITALNETLQKKHEALTNENDLFAIAEGALSLKKNVVTQKIGVFLEGKTTFTLADFEDFHKDVDDLDTQTKAFETAISKVPAHIKSAFECLVDQNKALKTLKEELTQLKVSEGLDEIKIEDGIRQLNHAYRALLDEIQVEAETLDVDQKQLQNRQNILKRKTAKKTEAYEAHKQLITDFEKSDNDTSALKAFQTSCDEEHKSKGRSSNWTTVNTTVTTIFDTTLTAVQSTKHAVLLPPEFDPRTPAHIVSALLDIDMQITTLTTLKKAKQQAYEQTKQQAQNAIALIQAIKDLNTAIADAEKTLGRIESFADPELINQWNKKLKEAQDVLTTTKKPGAPTEQEKAPETSEEMKKTLKITKKIFVIENKLQSFQSLITVLQTQLTAQPENEQHKALSKEIAEFSITTALIGNARPLNKLAEKVGKFCAQSKEKPVSGDINSPHKKSPHLSKLEQPNRALTPPQSLKLSDAALQHMQPIKEPKLAASNHSKPQMIRYRTKGTLYGAIAGIGITVAICASIVLLTYLTAGLALPFIITLGVAAALSPAIGGAIGRFFGWRKDKNTLATLPPPAKKSVAFAIDEPKKDERIADVGQAEASSDLAEQIRAAEQAAEERAAVKKHADEQFALRGASITKIDTFNKNPIKYKSMRLSDWGNEQNNKPVGVEAPVSNTAPALNAGEGDIAPSFPIGQAPARKSSPPIPTSLAGIFGPLSRSGSGEERKATPPQKDAFKDSDYTLLGGTIKGLKVSFSKKPTAEHLHGEASKPIITNANRPGY